MDVWQMFQRLARMLRYGRSVKRHRFVLGHVGKTQVDAGTQSVMLLAGCDGSSRIAQCLELTRQAIVQGCTVLFIDTMPGRDNVTRLCGFARQARRENAFYVKGAFDASDVRVADVLAHGDILYVGPSAAAGSPQAYAAETAPLLEELSAALMQRVAQPRTGHVVIVMLDVIEAFGGFPEQIRTLPSILRSVDASLICCEFDEGPAGSDFFQSLDFLVKLRSAPAPHLQRRNAVSRREALRDGQALIEIRNTRHDIGPVVLSYLRAEPAPLGSITAVNMTSAGTEVDTF